jgi:GH15 family glucan-1,4-alpha-glucosidase
VCGESRGGIGVKRARASYYGIVGNGETAALIGPEASVDWFCAPRFDGVPVLAAALDPARGGRLQLDFGPPLAPQAQAYAGRTNVLVTKLASPELTVESRDFMPWGKRCLIREITAQSTGPAPLYLSFSPRLSPVCSALFPLASHPLSGAEWAHRQATALTGSGWALVCGLLPQAPAPDSAPLFPHLLAPGAQFSWRVVLAYGDTLEAAAAEFGRAGAEEFSETLAFWTDWLSQAKPVNLPDAELEEPYYRSLLVLKLREIIGSGRGDRDLEVAQAELAAVHDQSHDDHRQDKIENEKQ